MYTIVNFNNNAAITQISPTTDKAVVTQDNDSAFTIKVPIGTQTVKANITLADKSGLLYINDRLVNDGKVRHLQSTVKANHLHLKHTPKTTQHTRITR